MVVHTDGESIGRMKVLGKMNNGKGCCSMFKPSSEVTPMTDFIRE